MFAGLYDRYADLVYRKCLSFAKSREEAQDMSHDIFVLLFARLRTFKAKSRFSTWLYSFVYNFCVNHVKRKMKKRNEKIVLAEDIGRFSEPQVSDEEIYELKSVKLEKALKQLGPEDKMVLLMKYQDEMSIKDIQASLNLGQSAVKMRLNRAKSRLMTIYNDL